MVGLRFYTSGRCPWVTSLLQRDNARWKKYSAPRRDRL